MTRGTRRIIFYVLFGLFFLIGAIVVLYAQGWRLDPKTLRPEKVGAIFVRSFPGDAAITLDGEAIANQSGFLSRGTLISNLYPRTYALTLAKEGYGEWHENVGVAPALVTELKYAVLVPSTSTPIATSTSVARFFVAGDQRVVQTPGGTIVSRGTRISGAGAMIDASADLGTLLLKNSPGDYALYDLQENTSTALLLPRDISRIAMDPSDAAKVIAIKNSAVMIADTARATTTVAASAPAGISFGKTFSIMSSVIAWPRSNAVEGLSSLAFYDMFTKTLARSSGTIPGIVADVQWVDSARVGALTADGALYLYDTNARTFTKIAGEVRAFAVAPDLSAIAALEARSVDVIPLADTTTYRRFNIPAVADVLRLIWYKDAGHLFLVYPDHASFLDLDDLGLRNFLTIAEGTSPLYSPSENSFYLINSAQKLIRFDFPQ